jgi:hypothetical protein
MRFRVCALLTVGTVLLAAVISGGVAAASPVLVAPSSAASRTIRGTVGPGMTITVSRHRAPSGRYRIVVRDRSSIHNWHIKGPSANKRTSVFGTGRTVWRVRLAPGLYRIRCDVHRATMHTRLRVH